MLEETKQGNFNYLYTTSQTFTKVFYYHPQIKELWDSCSKLPVTVYNWYAYKELKEFLTNYLDIFPILQQLASKVCFDVFIMLFRYSVISCHWVISIPPGIIRKSEVFWCFQGVLEDTSDMKRTKILNFAFSIVKLI